jgi:transcriptional regulator with XRE-family HTH domain
MPRDLDPQQKRRAKDFIRQLADEKGWGPSALAKQLGIAQPSASNLLSATHPGGPSYDTMAKAAELAGIQVEPFLRRGERLPVASVRNLPEYAAIRADLEARFRPEVLDAATRALDVLPVAGISPENFTDAALFSQKHMQVQRTKATGAAARGIANLERIQDRATSKRKAKAE